MSSRWVMALGTAGVLLAGEARAQGPAVAPTRQRSTGVVAGAVESKIAPNRPYSAEAVTETVHVLADGNRISRTMMTKVYRDGAGRTRRENFADQSAPVMIAINDPVAHVNYTLEPHRKVAFKNDGSIMMPTLAHGSAARTEAPHVTAPPPPPPPPPPAPPDPPAPDGAVLMRTPAPDNANARAEDLGMRTIEGVLARGTRTTTTIPAGQIGNLQEIRIVSERWFSDDLQVLVLTQHSDPRSGETTYRLRNIVRAEPDPSLFTVPADYTVESRRVRRPE